MGELLASPALLLGGVPTPPSKETRILVTGGNGFIGSHLAKRLFDEGYFVRIVDIAPASKFSCDIADETLITNLCDIDHCHRAVEGMHVVLHLAAQMGGMGTIHSSNDQQIYDHNHLLTTNILKASSSPLSSVDLFFYASSACVYPNDLQNHPSDDVSLRESDVQAHPSLPQGLYGLEKLNSEKLVRAHRHLTAPKKSFDIRIARFHNVYGPRGSFMDGREKAPAAMLRKAHVAKIALDRHDGVGEPALKMEIWGDGSQRRSFLFIDDAVDAVLLLLSSDYHKPINIGSDRSVTIASLADIALSTVGLTRQSVPFDFDTDKEVGVASRNSNNDLIGRKLGWSPKVSLEEGMTRTSAWIGAELREIASRPDDDTLLATLSTSRLTDLANEVISFAILLPVTSRGHDGDREACLRSLEKFAESLLRTTWRDTHQLGAVRFRFHIYVGLDLDNDFLRAAEGGLNRVEKTLTESGIVRSFITTLVLNRPRGHVCALWRDCAARAWEDKCDYYVLLGDDVSLLDEGWMRDIHGAFVSLSAERRLPHGIGCVAFTDVSFPGMPTFPVVHRTHLEIFKGQVIPDRFINQDGDPFLFQLYRRFGASAMLPTRVHNDVGGSGLARYDKVSAADWTFDLLDDATTAVDRWLSDGKFPDRRLLTVDIIIPSYRVNMALLRPMLSLSSSSSVSLGFVVIVDDPHASGLQSLESEFSHRPDVRIRVNRTNQGASASRNRGLGESAAEWVLFLDDDVKPSSDIIVELEKAIRANPRAAGFVGNSLFPEADTVFTAALHLSGVMYFWDIASKLKQEIPWGVTANLAARRVHDGVAFDLRFPKTGGGEDIDYCLRRAEASKSRDGEGFIGAPSVVVTHPWWHNGSRSYGRFFGWARGDGALIAKYPGLSYYDFGPNSGEWLLLGSTLCVVECFVILARLSHPPLSPYLLGAIVVANVVHDLYRHLFRDVDRTTSIRTSLSGWKWAMAIIDSTFIRMTTELGRVVGMLERGEHWQLGRRFDWFTALAGNGPRSEERRNSLQRSFLICMLVFIVLV